MFRLKRDYYRSRRTARRMIERAGQSAVLRRAGAADRWCSVVIQDYGPMERLGKMYDPTDRKALIAVNDDLLRTPPDRDLDVLILFQQPIFDDPVEYEKLRFTAPIVPIAPSGIVVRWKATVRGSQPPSLA